MAESESSPMPDATAKGERIPTVICDDVHIVYRVHGAGSGKGSGTGKDSGSSGSSGSSTGASPTPASSTASA